MSKLKNLKNNPTPLKTMKNYGKKRGTRVKYCIKSKCSSNQSEVYLIKAFSKIEQPM